MTATDNVGNAGLATSASRGAVVTLAWQAVRVVVQLAGIVVLARLLGPGDYGLVAMVTVIIGIGEVFRDFGLSSAAIQAKTLSREQKDNLFWINAGIGLALTIIVCALASPIAAFYDDERLRYLTFALSSTFLINGLTTQFRADLARNLGFFRLSVADVIGQVIALAISIVLAASGAGYWALAVQQVSQALIILITLVLITGWMPGGMHRHAGMKPFMTYGSSIFGAQILGYLSRNVDSLIIGARFGAVELGIYNRAYQLMMMPLIQLQAPSTRVALPVLSRLQDARERFNAFISFGQNALLTLVGLVFALVGSQASAVVQIALGPTWLAAVPIFQILLVAGFFQAAGYAVYWIVLAKGLTRLNFLYSLFTRPMVIGLIALGSIWGVSGVAVGSAVAAGLMWPIGLFWVGRATDVDVKVLYWNGVRGVVVFGGATIVSYFSTIGMHEEHPVLRLLLGWTVLAATLALFVAVWPRYRRDMVALVEGRKLLSRKKSTKAAGPDAGPTAPEPAGSSDRADAGESVKEST